MDRAIDGGMGGGIDVEIKGWDGQRDGLRVGQSDGQRVWMERRTERWAEG
jgi:hypothetical protein